MTNSYDDKLKDKWDELLFFEKLISQGSTKALDTTIAEIKREIRVLNRNYDEWCKKPRWKQMREDWDSCYMLYKLPYLMNEDETREYIDSIWCHWYNPYGDGRDCTGVWFTVGINCVPVPEMNETIVIHRKGCDV